VIEPASEKHLKYLWAAYKREATEFDPDLSPDDFSVLVLAKMADDIQMGNDSYVMIGKTPRGKIPVGMVTVAVTEPKDVKPQIVPTFVWFPEASPRNILECTLRFLVDFKADHKIFITVGERDWRFLAHLCDYGTMRKVGYHRKHFQDGANANLYESVSK